MVKQMQRKPKKININRSFKPHPKSKYWSPKNSVSPEDVAGFSNKKFWFDCSCGHDFPIVLYSVQNKNWCPYCCVPQKKLCDNMNCEPCFHKSFASQQKSEYWHPDNIKIPRYVLKTSQILYKFKCPVCSHTFESDPCNITFNDIGCPYCSHTKLCPDDDCEFCWNNSFASIPNSAHWSQKNKITPRACFKRSPSTHKFDCPYCNQEYKSQLRHVSNGTFCGCKKNKTETKLMMCLHKIFGQSKIERQKKFGWCVNKISLPFDFCVEHLKILIECDGPQHFVQVSNWQKPEFTKARDLYKMKCANAHGYTVLRLYQPDVWGDKYDWESTLKNDIIKYDRPMMICFGDIYRNHFGKQ